MLCEDQVPERTFYQILFLRGTCRAGFLVCLITVYIATGKIACVYFLIVRQSSDWCFVNMKVVFQSRGERDSLISAQQLMEG